LDYFAYETVKSKDVLWKRGIFSPSQGSEFWGPPPYKTNSKDMEIIPIITPAVRILLDNKLKSYFTNMLIQLAPAG
jgi:hypothetical protein